MTQKILITIKAVHRVCTVKPTWYIMDNGQFANSSNIVIIDKINSWTYDGSVISKSELCNFKRLPVLSLEFSYDTTLINMDDFIAATKYKADEEPPLAVVMAAFCIKTESLYPWARSKFTGFSSSGNILDFQGDITSTNPIFDN